MSNKHLDNAEFKRLDKLRTQLEDIRRASPTPNSKKEQTWRKKYGAELAALEEKDAKALGPSGSESEAMAQYESICEMVAALECDYERLEELREMRDDGDTIMSADEAEELAALAEAAGECTSRDDAEQRIHEDALSVEARCGWYSPSGDGLDTVPEEFKILLCTGGPACQIRGELNEHGEPSRAWLEYQHGGTPWRRLINDREGDVVSQDALLVYARCFYFGEG